MDKKKNKDQFSGEEPSFVRRAIARMKAKGDALQLDRSRSDAPKPAAKEKEKSLKLEFKDVEDTPGSYHPVWKDFSEVDHVNKILHARSSHGSSGLFADRETKMKVVKFSISLVVFFAWYKVHSAQVEKVRAKKAATNQIAFKPKAAEKKDASGVKFIEEIFSRSHAAKKLKRDGAPPGSSILNEEEKIKPLKIVPEMARRYRWHYLYQCAAKSIWSGYHSPRLQKMTDDLIAYTVANHVVFYSPKGTLMKRIFRGPDVRKIAKPFFRLFKKDFRRFQEKRYLNVTYPIRVQGLTIDGSFLLVPLRPGGHLNEAMFVVDVDHSFRMQEYTPVFGAERLLKNTRQKVNVAARKLLIKELEYQVRKFRANSMQAFRLFSAEAPKDEVGHQINILKMCEAAALAYNNPYLSKNATEQIDLIATTAALTDPDLKLSTDFISGSLDAKVVVATLTYNLRMLKSCFQSETSILRGWFPVTLLVGADGLVSLVKPGTGTMREKSVKSCVSRKMKRFFFGQTTTGKEAQISVKILAQ